MFQHVFSRESSGVSTKRFALNYVYNKLGYCLHLFSLYSFIFTCSAKNLGNSGNFEHNL
jgi:hypothetical protein